MHYYRIDLLSVSASALRQQRICCSRLFLCVVFFQASIAEAAKKKTKNNYRIVAVGRWMRRAAMVCRLLVDGKNRLGYRSPIRSAENYYCE